MALTQAEKDAIKSAALSKSKRTSVDGLLNERRSNADLRDGYELANDMDAGANPTARIHLATMIPPGSLDG